LFKLRIFKSKKKLLVPSGILIPNFILTANIIPNLF
jgi:hypothetical protein